MRRSFFLTNFLVVFLAFAMLFTGTPLTANAQSIGISVSFGPPPIPYYVQPPDPQPNYMWSPGYWAYDPYNGYYWVPGTWVPAPQYGYLWTPGYWGWNGDAFIWSSGYWGPQIGYYGDVDYGYGYYGRGYEGGRWRGREFEYNTAVTNVNRNVIRNVYDNRAVVDNHWNRVSYNGGRGGVVARPTVNELAVRRDPHVAPTNVQMQHARFASTNRAFSSSVNHGHPAIGAVARPLTRPAVGRMAMPQRAAGAPQARRAMAAPAQHSYAQPQHMAAPAQHSYAQPQHMAAPAQHSYAQPQHMAAPAQHSYAQPQRMAAPAQHSYAQPQHMAAPAAHGAPAGQRAAAPPAHGGPAAGGNQRNQPQH